MTVPAATDRTDLEARFNAFLRLLDEPYGGKVLFTHYAPEAGLPHKFEVVPAAELGADAFAYGLAAGALMHEEEPGQGPRRPVIPEATLLSLDDDLDGHRVAWFRAHEAVDGTGLFIAVGLRRGADGAWRIGWLTLAPAQAPWSYREGLVQALADFPFALNAGMGLPRSWLDLAWFRLHGHARPALSFLPEARFGCGGSTACCVKGFNIDVPPGVQAFVDAIPWEDHAPHLKGTTFEPIDGRRLRLKRHDEDCRFLDDDRRCRIHAIVGRSVFPTCTIYPILFQDTPDGVAVATSPSCPSARANVGPPLADRMEDLYGRLAMRRPSVPDAFRLEKGAAPDWPAYQAAEAGLLALLDRTDLPLARRLWLGAAGLDAGRFDDLDRRPAPTSHDPDGVRRTLLAGLASRFKLPVPEAEAWAPRDLDPDVEARLASMFRNQLHAKAHGARHGLRLAHHVNVLGFMLVRWVVARHGATEPPATLYWQVGAALMHGALGTALDAQPELLEMMTEPGFAAWMLGDPQAV